MIYAGFDSILDESGTGTTGYVDGFVAPVPDANKGRYLSLAKMASDVFIEYGATRVVEAWGDDVPDGKVTDYNRAAHRKDGESVIYSWVEWPSKEARVAGWEKVMADERMTPEPAEDRPFDGMRMIYGGFEPIVQA
nr:DUF1428 domain-containing protein [Sphingopyxis sp. PET50]